MKFETFPIPTANVDYREVARVMELNIKRLKEEITDHVNLEIKRFYSEISEEDD